MGSANAWGLLARISTTPAPCRAKPDFTRAGRSETATAVSWPAESCGGPSCPRLASSDENHLRTAGSASSNASGSGFSRIHFASAITPDSWAAGSATPAGRVGIRSRYFRISTGIGADSDNPHEWARSARRSAVGGVTGAVAGGVAGGASVGASCASGNDAHSSAADPATAGAIGAAGASCTTGNSFQSSAAAAVIIVGEGEGVDTSATGKASHSDACGAIGCVVAMTGATRGIGGAVTGAAAVIAAGAGGVGVSASGKAFHGSTEGTDAGTAGAVVGGGVSLTALSIGAAAVGTLTAGAVLGEDTRDGGGSVAVAESASGKESHSEAIIEPRLRPALLRSPPLNGHDARSRYGTVRTCPSGDMNRVPRGRRRASAGLFTRTMPVGWAAG